MQKHNEETLKRKQAKKEESEKEDKMLAEYQRIKAVSNFLRIANSNFNLN